MKNNVVFKEDCDLSFNFILKKKKKKSQVEDVTYSNFFIILEFKFENAIF